MELIKFLCSVVHNIILITGSRSILFECIMFVRIVLFGVDGPGLTVRRFGNIRAIE